MQRLTGKIAWITGAGSGIGEAGALALAEEGASVMLTGRRRELLEAVAARIAKHGGTARVHPGDMSRSEDASAIADAIEKDFGRLDILVNNAGPTFPIGVGSGSPRPASRILSGRTCRAHSMARSRRCRSCASRRTA